MPDLPQALLDLDATPGPPEPRSLRAPVLSFRTRPHVARWVRDQAQLEGCTPNAWLERLVIAARDGQARLPADVVDWLAVEAVQLGCPGDVHEAEVRVLRHLADRWPNGARLHP